MADQNSLEAQNRAWAQQLAQTGVNPDLQVMPGDESKPANTIGNFFLNLIGAPPQMGATVAEDKQHLQTLPQQMGMGTTGSLAKIGGANRIIQGNLGAILEKARVSPDKLTAAESIIAKQHLNPNSTTFNTPGIAPNTIRFGPGFAKGGEVQPQDNNGIRIMSPEEQSQYSVLKPAAGRFLPGDANTPNPTLQSQMPQAPENFQLPPAAPQQQPIMSAQPNMLQQSYGNQVQGLATQAGAESKLGKGEEAAATDKVAKAQQLEQAYTQNLAHLDEQRKKISDDIEAGHIDPDRYANNLGTSGRIQSAIGIFLSGLGTAAMGGQGNPALDFFNKQIDRDIESQKVNLSKKQNMLSALDHQFNNLNDSTNAMRVIYADKYAADIAKAAAASKDPMAKGRAQQLIGQLQGQYAPLMQQMALKQTVMQGEQSGHIEPEQAVPFMVPEPHQKAVFGEIERAKNTHHMAGSILDAFDKAAVDTRPLSGGQLRYALPGVTSPNVLALHQHMQPTFQDLEGTVRQAAMDNTFKNITPQTGDDDRTIAIKRHTLEQYLQAKSAAPTAKAYGIDLSTYKSTAPMNGKVGTPIQKPANYGR